MKRIVIKIGNILLTDETGAASEHRVASVVDEISDIRNAGWQAIIVSSGAPTWGRSAPQLTGDFHVEEPEAGRRQSQRQAIRQQILASVGQPLLMARYCELFRLRNHVAAQVLVTRFDLAEQPRYESVRAVTLNLLHLGIVPIFNSNDVLSTEEIGFGDNAQLACMLATALQADRLVILDDCDRLLDRDGGVIPVVRDIEALRHDAASSDDKAATAGLRSVLEAAGLVTAFGVECNVVNGSRPGALRHLLLGGLAIGTAFPPKGKKLRQRKSWVALAAQSRGEVVVSTFLAEALSAHKPASILVIGVERVLGTFQQNDVVTVKDVAGRTLGRGEVRMSSADLQDKLERRRRGELLELFGTEVIHCDYFVGAGHRAVEDV